MPPSTLVYSYQLNRFKKPVILELTQDELILLGAQGAATKRVPLRSVDRIQRFDGVGDNRLAPSAPGGGSDTIEYARVHARGWPSTNISNERHVRASDDSIEQECVESAGFEEFVTELTHRVAKANPSAVVVRGALGASLTWWCVAVLGGAIAALGPAAFFYDSFWTALAIFVIAVPFGLLIAGLGAGFGKSYWPSQISIEDEAAAQ